MTNNPNNPEVSVIIPSYNDATYIDRLLEALAKQTGIDFEVIVSDAQSGDGTAEIVREFEKKLNITFVESSPHGPAHGRNVWGQKKPRANGYCFWMPMMILMTRSSFL